MPLADFANDLRELQNDFPSRLEYLGRTYKVTATEITQQVSVDENGLYVPKSFDVIGVLSDFGGAIPPNRSTVALDDVTCQVGDVETDSGTNTIRFFLSKS